MKCQHLFSVQSLLICGSGKIGEFDADTFEYKTDSLEAGLMFCIEEQEESAVFG